MKTTIKRKLIEIDACEAINNSPRKQLKEPKIILKKLPDRYINELLQKRKKANNSNLIDMDPNKNINKHITRSRSKNNKVIMNNEQENLENKEGSHLQLLFQEENNIFHQGIYDVIIKGEKLNENEIINIE